MLPTASALFYNQGQPSDFEKPFPGGDRYIIGAVDPIPLRKRCAFNVVSHGLCRLVHRVRAKQATACPTGFRGLLDGDFERSVDMIQRFASAKG